MNCRAHERQQNSRGRQVGGKDAETASTADVGEDLPLALSTLEDDSVSKALSLDSNLSEVVEAVAKGDIKPLTEKRQWGPPKGMPPKEQGDSVGRGPVAPQADFPATVRHLSALLATLFRGRSCIPSRSHHITGDSLQTMHTFLIASP